MIGQWLNTDHYSPELIRLALREAVLNQAYSLKYIDRIYLRGSVKILPPKNKLLLIRKTKRFYDSK